MMRRFLILLLTLLLAVPAALAAEESVINLDSLTAEELTALHQEVIRRLTTVNSGDIIYDQDGITIRWVKLLDLDDDNFRCGITVENTMGRDIGIEISWIAINGMQFEPRWNCYTELVKNGFSLYTGSYNNWKPDNYLADFGITHVTDIALQVELYERDGSGFEYKPFQVIDMRFPVDIDISGELK